MPSGRRVGRHEEQNFFIQNCTQNQTASFSDEMQHAARKQANGFMDMLMHEPPPMNTTHIPIETYGTRTRKQGNTVRHPLDLIDTNILSSHRDVGNNSQLLENNGEKRKSNIFTLRRTSSLASSVASRKSNKSNKSLRSNVTITSTRSTSSYMRKNSGNFDGGNTRRRKSTNSSQKSSSASNRDQIIAEFYKELEQLEEISSSSTDDDDDDDNRNKKKSKNKKLEKLESENSKKRVEEYVLKHSVAQNGFDMDIDEGFDTNSETKSRNSEYSDARRRNYDKYKTENELFDRSTEQSSSQKCTNKNGNEQRNMIRHRQMQDPHISLEQRILRGQLIVQKQNTNVETTTKKIESTKLHMRDKRYIAKDHSSSSSPAQTADCKNNPQTVGELLIDLNCNDINKLRERSREKSKRSKSHTSNTQEKVIQTRQKREIYEKDMSGSESSLSTDSAHGSTRSMSTVSSCSNIDKFSPRIHRASTPHNNLNSSNRKNTANRSKDKSSTTSFKIGQNTSFCFKGITCRMQQDTPRTFKAFAHAGCLALIITGPSAHKCQL